MCLRPITIKNPNYFDENTAPSHRYANSRNVCGRCMTVPCGKCIECVRRRQNQLSWLCEQEMKRTNEPALFVTLTYDDEHLPKQHIVRSEVDEETGEMYTTEETVPTVCKKQIQNFLKRVRKEWHEDFPLRVVWCTEYGSKFHRPHAHIIFFGAYFKELYPILVKCWTTPKKSKFDTNERLGYVFADHRPAGVGSLKYLAKYSFKPSAHKDAELDPLRPYTEWEKRYVYCAENPDGFIEKPVARHSVRLGYNYLFNDDGTLKEEIVAKHKTLVKNDCGRLCPDDSIVYGATDNGEPIIGRLPNIFAKKIYTSAERVEQFYSRTEQMYYDEIEQRKKIYNDEHRQNPCTVPTKSIIDSLLQDHCVPENALCLFDESIMVKMHHSAIQKEFDSYRKGVDSFKRDVQKSLF